MAPLDDTTGLLSPAPAPVALPADPDAERRANIDRVIEAIRAEEVAGRKYRFNMNRWIERDYQGCGTAACIGGTVCLMLGDSPDQINLGGGSDVEAKAAHFLRLPPSSARRLFFPDEVYGVGVSSWEYLTQVQAIRVLEIWRDESVVDWPRAVREADGLAGGAA